MPLSSMKINETRVPSSLVYNFRTIIMEGVKNGYFTVRLTVRGGGFIYLGPDSKQM